MTKLRERKIELTAYDELFITDKEREEAKLSKIVEIPISMIDDFPDHPYKVQMDSDMEELIDSIERNGVMSPATVRLKDDGRYELISGHRRKKACQMLEKETLRCEIRELTKDEAILAMVESNLHRSRILPSEKAKSYKMKLEAMKRQGQHSDLTSTPVAWKSRRSETADIVGSALGESGDQVRRYIRLTELIPEILQMVDEGYIAFRPAVEISYLSEEYQRMLHYEMGAAQATPSLAQAIMFKKQFQEGKLNEEEIRKAMKAQKANQKQFSIKDSDLRELIPPEIPELEQKKFIKEAIQFYARHLKRKKDRER